MSAAKTPLVVSSTHDQLARDGNTCCLHCVAQRDPGCGTIVTSITSVLQRHVHACRYGRGTGDNSLLHCHKVLHLLLSAEACGHHRLQLQTRLALHFNKGLIVEFSKLPNTHQSAHL